MRNLLALVALIGCAKAGAPKPVRSTCDDVAARAAALYPRDPTGNDRADFSEQYGAMARARCAEDAWTQGLIDCFVTAEDLKTCRSLVTDEQDARLNAFESALVRGDPAPEL